MGPPAGTIERHGMNEEPRFTGDGVDRVTDRVSLSRDGMVPEETSGPAQHELGTVTGEPHETPSAAAGSISQLQRGAERLALARRVDELRAAGIGWDEVAARLGVKRTTAYRLHGELIRGTLQTAAGFAPARPGPKSRPVFLDAEREVVRADVILSNRTRTDGSRPEALRRAIRAGAVRPEIADLIESRIAEGKQPLTRRMRNELRVGEAQTRAFRNPREAWLDYVSSPGSLQLVVDQRTGEERYINPGEAWTIDDASINLVCLVPTCDPRWKHGVMVGRFQFLLVVDHRSYFIPAFSYTARPRDSYRAEDILATLHIGFMEHGLPKQLILEHGVSAANSITRMCQMAGIEIIRASSPHQKMVEMVFNSLWTKLSFLPGQVGRYRGEEAEVSELMEQCRKGTVDPRQHFLMLKDVLQALREVIVDWNSHMVMSERYGHWRPGEFWQSAATELRQLAPEDHWIFAPTVAGPLSVRGMQVQTSVALAPGYSQVFSFAMDHLAEFVGAKVNIHFNPFAPDSFGKVVLAETFAGTAAGTVLGDTIMIDRQARHTRRAWGYSDEQDIGREATRRNAQALHRSAFAIRPDGKPTIASVDVRDGVGQEVTFQTMHPASPSQAPTGETVMAGPSRVGKLDGPRLSEREEMTLRAREAFEVRKVDRSNRVEDVDLIEV